MDAHQLLRAIEASADMLKTQPYGHLAIYLAYENGVDKALVVNGNSLFTRLVFQGAAVYDRIRAKPVRFAGHMRAPSKLDVWAHAVWMMEWLHNLSSVTKQHRWFGFIDGALDYHNVITNPHEPWVKANAQNVIEMQNRAVRTMDQLEMCIKREDGPFRNYCLIAEYVLGYMQGVLWAAGKCSIDEMRAMNKPADEPFRARA